jgi:hypothetical protein
MQCIICDAPMRYFFSKHIAYAGVGDVDYHRCPECGFTASATHFEMNQHDWEALNARFHADPVANGPDNPDNRPPPYVEQARMLDVLHRDGLVEGEPWLDWGAGEASLSRILAERHGLRLRNFDRFRRPPHDATSEAELRPGRYNLVVNSALFEHVRTRATLDEIHACVHPDHGVLAIHTLVRGEIPRDPDWMYLLPVHCAFHTNPSMQRLMEQWGYTCSVYNPAAKLWAMFRQPPDTVRAGAERVNARLGETYLHFKTGFMDYWP